MKEKAEKLFYNPIWQGMFPVFIICLIGFIIYSNTFQCSWHLDDETSIVTNLKIRNLSDIKAIWEFWPTRFITYVSFAVNYHFNQLNVFGYHIVNFIVHLLTSVCLWRLVLLTMSAETIKNTKIAKYSGLIAFFSGLLFVSHPIQTEGVTYITQRAASLATLFYLLSLCLYGKSRLLYGKEIGSHVWIFYYIGSFIAAVMAMFTEEIAISLPFIILLYESCFFRHHPPQSAAAGGFLPQGTPPKAVSQRDVGKRCGINLKLTLPFLPLIIVIPLTMFLTKTVDFREMRLLKETPPGISPIHYLLTQSRVLLTYIRLLFLPLKQNLDYDYSISTSLIDMRVLISIAFLAVIIFSAFRAYSRYRLVSFGILWFFITVLPVSSIIPIQDVIFEHRLYLPMAGFSIFLVCGLYYLFENEGIKPVIIILFAIISVFSILTYNRNLIWKDEFTLWDDAILKAPQKARPYNGRGLAYQKNGNFEMAIVDYTKAIQLDPNFYNPLCNRGVVYRNYKNDFAGAISDFNAAIRIKPDDPKAYNNRGLNYLMQGNFDLAINDFNKVLQIDSYSAGAYYNRGLVYQKKGELNSAISDYNKAIQLEPNLAEAYNNRGTVYFDQGEYEKCLSDINKAMELGYKVRKEFLNEILKRAGAENPRS